MKTLNEIIDNHPFWNGLELGEYRGLHECASTVHFGEQQSIFEEGAEADRFYLIENGRVALGTYVTGRGVVTIQTIGEGDVLGWSWLFPPYRWHFSAKSIQETEAIVFDANRLREMAEADPRFGYLLAMRLGELVLHRLQATRMQLLDFYGDR